MHLVSLFNWKIIALFKFIRNAKKKNTNEYKWYCKQYSAVIYPNSDPTK